MNPYVDFLVKSLKISKDSTEQFVVLDLIREKTNIDEFAKIYVKNIELLNRDVKIKYTKDSELNKTICYNQIMSCRENPNMISELTIHMFTYINCGEFIPSERIIINDVLYKFILSNLNFETIYNYFVLLYDKYNIIHKLCEDTNFVKECFNNKTLNYKIFNYLVCITTHLCPIIDRIFSQLNENLVYDLIITSLVGMELEIDAHLCNVFDKIFYMVNPYLRKKIILANLVYLKTSKVSSELTFYIWYYSKTVPMVQNEIFYNYCFKELNSGNVSKEIDDLFLIENFMSNIILYLHSKLSTDKSDEFNVLARLISNYDSVFNTKCRLTNIKKFFDICLKINYNLQNCDEFLLFYFKDIKHFNETYLNLNVSTSIKELFNKIHKKLNG